MKRLILATITVIFCVCPLVAQNPKEAKPARCSLQLDRAPELRGFRLGAPQSAVLARFPGTSLGKPDQFGTARLGVVVIDSSVLAKGLPRPDKAVQPDLASGDESAFVLDNSRFPALKGVRRFRLLFTDGRLSWAEVAYDDTIKWDSVDMFVETVARALNLPTTWNLTSSGDDSDRVRELGCESFMITANVGHDPSDTHIAARLTIEDLAASKLVEKRQNDLKEKAQQDEDAKRKNFKP